MGMDGRYELGALLGRGGMGSVHAGRHTLTGRRVAIKRMSPELATDAMAVQRFLREARAAAAIDHPNVVQILDFGVDEHVPYIVMELLSGETLAALLAREGRLAPATILELLSPIFRALERAHAMGMVHRDLKPENVFLVASEVGPATPKLLDFGIARFYESEDERASHPLTSTGLVMGTPSFMSPEQAFGSKQLDQRCDVYALGVILYLAASGRLPHEKSSYNALILAIASEPPPPLDTLVPELPAWFVELVARAIAKSPDDRFASVTALREALETGVSGAPVARPSARPPVAATPRPRSDGALAHAKTIASSAPPPVRPRRWWVGAAAVVLLGVVAAVWIHPWSRAPQATAEPTVSEATAVPAPIAAPIAAPAVPIPATSTAPLGSDVPPAAASEAHGRGAVHVRPPPASAAPPTSMLAAPLAPPLAAPATTSAHRSGELHQDEFFP